MEEERKGYPAAVIGGMYAKAKQRVLNKIGRRTTLTRNPRVDFISKRVEEIKGKKARVASLARSARLQLEGAVKTIEELDATMVAAFNDELGERKLDDDNASYTRSLNSEERRMVADMDRVFNRCRDTMKKVLDTYLAHLEDTEEKPLTFHTPDEDARLANVMQTKDEYKAVRTLYSDAMIDVDADLSTGSAPNSATQQRLDDAKKAYERMSERLCEDALRYERIYRDELAQRVSTHFLAEQHLLRGVSTSMREFHPYTKGLTLDWQQMRATRRSNLDAAKSSPFDDGEDDLADRLDDLPAPSSSAGPRRDTLSDDDSRDSSHGGSALGGIASDMQRRGSNAASAISSAGKSASKSISDMVSNVSSKVATKTASQSVKSKFS